MTLRAPARRALHRRHQAHQAVRRALRLRWCGLLSHARLARRSGVLCRGGLFFRARSMGISFPLLNSVCVKCTASERKGAASAQFLLMKRPAASGWRALIWGVAIDAVGFVPVMVGGAVTAALTFVAALVMFPRDLEADGLRK